jgi:signal transduction histidine kinase
MKSPSTSAPSPWRIKRRLFSACAGVLLLAVAGHLLVFGDSRPQVALALIGWSASFMLLGVAVGTGRLPLWSPGLLAGLVSTSAVAEIVHATGGPRSPYFVTLVCIPLMVALFTPDSRLPTLGALGAMVLAVVGLHHLAGAAPHVYLPQTFVFGGIGGLGLYGGRTYRRLRESEKLAQEERLRALEQLAESERLRRHAETERVEMERLRLMVQLASGVAHEVNNPLAFVKSNLHYLERTLAGPYTPEAHTESRELLAETRQGVLRIQRLVSDLRYFSREGAAPDNLASPREALEEARRQAQARLGSLGEVVLDVAGELPPVRLNPRHLQQVLLNLLLNAADAVEESVPRRPGLIRLRARSDGGEVRLEVEDNGAGIPAHVLPRLFEPFFTTKAPDKGRGLGLTLCREYVARVGGSLTAENRLEGGARFVLTLNQAAKPSSPPPPS